MELDSALLTLSHLHDSSHAQLVQYFILLFGPLILWQCVILSLLRVMLPSKLFEFCECGAPILFDIHFLSVSQLLKNLSHGPWPSLFVEDIDVSIDSFSTACLCLLVLVVEIADYVEFLLA